MKNYLTMLVSCGPLESTSKYTAVSLLHKLHDNSRNYSNRITIIRKDLIYIQQFISLT